MDIWRLPEKGCFDLLSYYANSVTLLDSVLKQLFTLSVREYGGFLPLFSTFLVNNSHDVLITSISDHGGSSIIGALALSLP